MRKKITQNKKTVLTRLTSFLIAGSIIAAPICAVHATPTATQKNSSASTKTTQTIRKGSSTSAKTAQTTHKGSSASAKTTPAVKKGSSASAKTTQTTKKSSQASSKSSLTKITISAAGDCTLGSDIKSPASVNFYAKYREKKNPSYFLKKVKPIFKRDDMTLVNFEGTLTNRTTRAPKTFAFKGNASYLKILQKGSVESVSFANNHCRDYGVGSYRDTIKTFRKQKMPFASYGKTTIYKTKGKKIGMVAVNGLDGVSSSKNYIKSGLHKLKKQKADLIIVSMHCGIERTYTPNADQKTLAHYAIDHGANLVLGHHPHVLQGIEKYKSAYIVYSLANFCFGGNTNPPDKDTMIYQQTFVFQNDKLKKTNRIKIIPCSVSSSSGINNYQPTPATGKKATKIIQRVNRYSKSLGKVSFGKNGKIRSY